MFESHMRPPVDEAGEAYWFVVRRSEILVVDAHGNGENLLIDRFPPDVRIVRSWPRPAKGSWRSRPSPLWSFA